jgi:hypothetical protein
MASEDQTQMTENRAAKLAIIGLFVGSIATYAIEAARRHEQVDVTPFDLLLLGLASFRTGRMLAYERVAAPLRAPVTETRPDVSGFGETIVAKGTGAQEAIGELFSCPICLATWASAGMVYGLRFAPVPTRVLMTTLGATGVAEIVLSATEALSWIGRAARKQCGD